MRIEGYDRFGGVQVDSAVLCNAFRQAGIVAPHTGEPYTEAMLSGLGGGIGFMYFTFEYKGRTPTLTITARYHTMDWGYVEGMLERTQVGVTNKQTSSGNVAAKALVAALKAGKAPVCTVDTPSLPYHGYPLALRGGSPQLVAVVEVDQEAGVARMDDRCERPTTIDLSSLTVARGAYRKAKNRLFTIEPPEEPIDLAEAVRDAIGSTANFLLEPSLGRWSGNFGFPAMERFRERLTNPKDPKGWPRLFASGEALLVGLRRLHGCIEYDYSSTGAMRPLYASFLEEASKVTGQGALADVAEQIRASGALWQQMAHDALPDHIEPLRRCREITDRRDELLKTQGSDAAEEMRALYQEREDLGLVMARDNLLGPKERLAHFEMLAGYLDEIIAIERAAMEDLQLIVA